VASLLAAMLARAQSFLLEPATPPAALARRPPPPIQLEQVELAVLGSKPGCGASTVACCLASALAVPGARPAHVITLSEGLSRQPAPRVLAGGAVWEVPLALREPREVAEYGAELGGLAGRPSVVVWDVPACEARRAELVACDAQAVIVIVPGAGEPALGELLGRMLAERFGRVLVVANRADPAKWRGRADACLPESRIAARLAVRGSPPGGGFADALGELIELLEGRD
jgi:hypothetical protein